MIVRESPKAKGTGTTNPPNWPPKSPYEALISSPSGRRRYEERRARSSVSPSPAKRRPVSQPQAHDDGDTTEDEDEETLQLKLQAIEARLKLKQLQKARKTEPESRAIPSRPVTAAGLRRTERPRSDADVQVPVSPMRARHKPTEPRSPARVLLGIDKGLKASDVSLKRPGQIRATNGIARSNTTGAVGTPRIKSFSERIAESRVKEKQREENEQRHEERKARGFGSSSIAGLKRERPPSSRGSSFTSDTQSSFANMPQTRVSFTDMPTRSSFTDVPQTRSSFANTPQTRTSFADVPQTRTSFADIPQTRSSFTDMPPPGLKTHSRTHSRLLSSQESAPTPRRGSIPDARPPSSVSRPKSFPAPATTSSFSKYEEIAQRSDSFDGPSFESLSGLHLKSREMQHSVVTRTLEGKTVFTIPQLLKTVKGPAYDPPDWEHDYVVMGVICSKSSPRDTQNSARDNSRGNQERKEHGKFMVIRLTDMKWELDLFLFDSGYEHFWKLPIGTLVAILNPDIMPPKDRNSGKFSLKLTNSDDTILEIGVARDLDFCHAKKKDGKECGQWIDGRKTEFCEFHLALQVEKSKRGRMEINGMVGTGGGGGSGGGMFGRKPPNGFQGDALRKEGKYHDRFLHETMFIAPRPGGAARMLDKDDQGFERGGSREERHRRQLAAKEKERDLAKRLGEMGEGTTGGDYLKRRTNPSAPLSTTISQELANARQEKATECDYKGLLNRKAADVSLNRKASGSLIPSKRKYSNATKTAASTSAPVGWAGASRRTLVLSPQKPRALSPTKSRPDSALRGTRASSPAKKKARLLLPEKGIREPGRESLGGLDVGLIAAMDMDDDDDDLEVQEGWQRLWRLKCDPLIGWAKRGNIASLEKEQGTLDNYEEQGTCFNMASTSPASDAPIHALIDYEDPYVQPLILSALEKCLPASSYKLIKSLKDLPSSSTPCLQFVQYESIDWDHLMSNSKSLANAYVIRKALIRKHYLSTTIANWITKYPDSALKSGAKPSVEFEVDYAEFLDDALVEAWELKESWARNEQFGEDEKEKREWWILKPGMSDRGQGIRLFSSEEELTEIFEEWDPESDDEEEEEDARSDTGRTDDNDGIVTSQLRHFVAQPYIHPPLLLAPPGDPTQLRKFHIRTYILATGALRVSIYKPMLALFAASPYSPPWTTPFDSPAARDEALRAHLTNTCLQDSGDRDGSVGLFWDLPEALPSHPDAPRDWKDRVFDQIKAITAETFEAAARGMSIHFQPLPNAFEVFGLDFMVGIEADGALNTYLLEVNAFPDFRQTGEELSGVVAGLFEGVVGEAVAPFFGVEREGEGDGRMVRVLDVDLGRR
ncbi:tubulin-tyrosine ligase family-domain-containing protein [Boeremia exigua]|uniref:tubulin-tyrosine ligase family-domain-containing protein n=1 Tax=Boeremia exigua TaxID=749465 RepID=UPI001E8DCDFA|nr:tubulin-tyrosine ligase family-domain-containing protein [Boeremia exigua]KAH6616491.1 tubulin-tyrosine ligase family-domain-containing protein [Boeremia exigua]